MMKNFIGLIEILLELTKFKITSFVTITTFLGYILFTNELKTDLIGVLIGVLLLSSGSAIFNHYQERKYDALMQRTMNRPIPSGKVNAGVAFLLGLLFSVGGLLILSFGYNLFSAVLGLLALLWYNGIYTPLKRM